MDERQRFLLYNDNEATLDASSKRRIAVEVALDLIRHEAMSGSSRNSLDSNMRHLSDYADFIQEALRGSEQEALGGNEQEALKSRDRDASRDRDREASRGREH
ncbi:hypothetical protein PQR72_30645 [Paraburkholderia madseniana]|uniref:hypothetical protein n=1 Tax=Paraburkholderia madseniana TaxID=2599607 RepID=UPI0015C53F44|nr:hypothetical protein [Paraburkholderia madseniana]NPT68563.1 hypothetical protein [Paraburkholderia madseniana]